MLAATLTLAFGLQVPPEPGGSQASSESRGREVFAKHCVLCHRIGAEGQDYGPDLSDAGLRLTPEQVRESIMTPGKTIAPGFEMVQVSLRDGPPQVGILAPESAGMVLLRQQGGIVLRFKKSNVASTVRLPTSAMTDQTKDLQPGDIDAVVPYVLAQKSPRPKLPPPPAPIDAPASGGPPPLLLWLAAGSTLLLLALVLRGKGKARGAGRSLPSGE